MATTPISKVLLGAWDALEIALVRRECAQVLCEPRFVPDAVKPKAVVAHVDILGSGSHHGALEATMQRG
eukprot:SAG31_NODE_1894_length_6965_cov_26.137198_3_plen_69_part_00